MRVLHDYLLVKEIIEDNKLEGTNLTRAYDDTERFMTVEIIERSVELEAEYAKYYPMLSFQDSKMLVNSFYKHGTRLIINRVAKTPYKDGLFFISFKDIIAIEETDKQSDEHTKQLSIDDLI